LGVIHEILCLSFLWMKSIHKIREISRYLSISLESLYVFYIYIYLHILTCLLFDPFFFLLKKEGQLEIPNYFMSVSSFVHSTCNCAKFYSFGFGLALYLREAKAQNILQAWPPFCRAPIIPYVYQCSGGHSLLFHSFLFLLFKNLQIFYSKFLCPPHPPFFSTFFLVHLIVSLL
jgi:hypothetical protein